MVDVSCVICRSDRGKRKKYCSTKCQYEGLSAYYAAKRIKMTCGFCGIIYDVVASKVETTTFCCREHKDASQIGRPSPALGRVMPENEKKARGASIKRAFLRPEVKEAHMQALYEAEERLGFWPGTDAIAKAKASETYRERMGYRHPFSNPMVREKCEETCVKRHGMKSYELAFKAIDADVINKRRRTLIQTATGLSVQEWDALQTDKERYYREVRRLTENALSFLPGFDIFKRARAGIDGAFHVDHKIPIIYGFQNQLPASFIADVSNLRFIPAIENLKKGWKWVNDIKFV